MNLKIRKTTFIVHGNLTHEPELTLITITDGLMSRSSNQLPSTCTNMFQQKRHFEPLQNITYPIIIMITTNPAMKSVTQLMIDK